MHGPVLLPSPLATDALTLGQLVSDPLDPTSPSFLSNSPIARQQPFVQPLFKDLISQDGEGHFLSSLSGREISPMQDNLVMLRADEMEYTSLRNPSRAFDTIRQDTSAQSYLRKMARRNQPLFYVVGMQKLKNPTFKRAVIEQGAIAEAKTNSKVRLPMHVRRDSAMDVAEENHEGVFALEYRKVMCHIGSPTEPHSLEDIDYDWSYHRLDADGEVQLSIGLGKTLQAAELRNIAGLETDEDLSEDHYDSDYTDEDGMGGFYSD